MIRATTLPAILDRVGWLLLSLMIGALAGKIAKLVGAPLEIRFVAFVALAALTLAVWRVGRRAPEATAA
jgi:site-specific recombinase